jgi:hypothetical protein
MAPAIHESVVFTKRTEQITNQHGNTMVAEEASRLPGSETKTQLALSVSNAKQSAVIRSKLLVCNELLLVGQTSRFPGGLY